MTPERVVIGDCRDILKTLPDGAVQCCVTSPPYWGLRDYGTAKWDGGDPGCDHHRPRLGGNGATSPINGGGSARDESVGLQQYRDLCAKCGAQRIDAQIGLESTPQEYVEKLVTVFREVRRVLKNDGVLFLNLGDSYASGPAGNFAQDMTKPGDGGVYRENKPQMDYKRAGLKSKDMVGIPWMVAFALRADGWYLRQDIIWSKPNPMPESVTDRCTKAHEYLFLLSKSDRYYFDAKAIAEPCVVGDNGSSYTSAYDKATKPGLGTGPRKQRKPAGWDTGAGAHGTIHRDGRAQEVEYTETVAKTRNKRSVWTIPTQPFPEAHFATFPSKLVEPCILAGSRPGDVVLDPFLGSGTVGEVAERLGRRWIGIELNAEYVEIARRRAAQQGLLV